jgi:hypothetical protein
MKWSIISSVIQSLSIIVASFTAMYGITSWRREAKWKRKYELAEEILSLFYECKDNFKVIRSPAGNSSEGQTRKRGENETSEETARLDNAYVFIERYQAVKAPFIKLATLRFRFMAIFGKQSGEPFLEISKILNTIFLAARRLGMQYWRDQGHNQFNDSEFQKHIRKMHENEKIVWMDFEETDEISKRINNCISEIEKQCSSVMNK